MRATEEFEDDHYDVTVNGIAYHIYGPDVLGTARLWTVSRERTLAIINDLLAHAGSDERVYHLGGGEDGAAVFLTPAMVKLINGNQCLSESWIPGKP